jgi:hypothetical protein
MGSGGSKLRSEAKQTRLAAALRENLKRRKAQARTKTSKSAPGALVAAPQGRPENAPEPAARPKPAAKST